MIKVLFIGDIVGEPGRTAYMRALPSFIKEFDIDVVIANGENAAAGRGITPKLTTELLNAGTHVVTTGDHVWDQAELIPWLHCEHRIVRPLNYPKGTPGRGSTVIDTVKGKLAVIQVQGRTFTQPPLENPFVMIEQEVADIHQEHGSIPIIVDIHAETTSEKISMGYFLDGKVSAVIGTHTHVQTADETILENGTAYLTDAGMCGPSNSVLGREKDPIIKRFLTALPTKFPVANWPVRICGAVITIDETTGKAVAIERISRVMEKTTQA